MYRKPWKDQYFSPGETAGILRVTPATLRGWTNKGILRAETTSGGHRRYLVSEVSRLARTRGLDMDLSLDLSLQLLVIDGDVEYGLYLMKSLQELSGISDIEVTNDGFTAGCRVAQFKPDIVLLDLDAPKIDGYQICEFIKHDQQTKFIRVIAMSRHCSKKQKRIIDLGAEVCISKPFSVDQLEQVMGLAGPAGE